MTHTRTYTYEERAVELALEASDPQASETAQAKAAVALADWVKGMPEESRDRIRGAAEILLSAVDPT